MNAITLHLPNLPAIDAQRRSILDDSIHALSSQSQIKLKRHWKVFALWCQEQSVELCPAAEVVVRDFLQHRHDDNKSQSTINGDVWAIGWLHKKLGLTDPTDSEMIKAKRRRIRQQLKQAHRLEQKQAVGLRAAHIQAAGNILHRDKPGLISIRDMAIAWLAFVCLARRSEIAALNINDVVQNEDGTGLVKLLRTKTSSQSDSIALPKAVSDHINRWIDQAMLTDRNIHSPLFCNIKKNGIPGHNRLSDRDIARALKRVGAAAGIDVSGHSARVGGAQELRDANVNLAAIAAGRRLENRTHANSIH